MASRDLSNTKTTILGATPGAIPIIDGNPHEGFSFAPPFSERFFENWGGPCAQELNSLRIVLCNGRWCHRSREGQVQNVQFLAHQNRTIAIASDFRVDGAKLPEILQKEGVLGSEIAARNRKSLAIFHRTLKSQCSIALSCFRNRCDFWGPRWASQSQIAKIAAISVR